MNNNVPNFDKQISSQERGGGIRGVEQWIRMATDYKIVVVPDTGSTRPCIECSQCLRLQLLYTGNIHLTHTQSHSTVKGVCV